MKEDICQLIADYENQQGIADAERCTEFSQDFQMYVFKLTAEKSRIDEQLVKAKEAREGKFIASGRKVVAIFEKRIGDEHNIVDSSSFALTQENELIKSFFLVEAKEKKIGLRFGDDETYFLLKKRDSAVIELLDLPLEVGNRFLERMDDTRNRWLKKYMELERAQISAQIDKIIAEGENTQAKQEKYDFAKKIEQRAKTNKKVFFEEHMEGYDFRGYDLSNAIFINSAISNSNFCGCNLEDAIFVNCIMPNCLFHGAMLNNCYAYFGGSILHLEDKTRRILK